MHSHLTGVLIHGLDPTYINTLCTSVECRLRENYATRPKTHETHPPTVLGGIFSPMYMDTTFFSNVKKIPYCDRSALISSDHCSLRPGGSRGVSAIVYSIAGQYTACTDSRCSMLPGLCRLHHPTMMPASVRHHRTCRPRRYGRTCAS